MALFSQNCPKVPAYTCTAVLVEQVLLRVLLRVLLPDALHPPLSFSRVTEQVLLRLGLDSDPMVAGGTDNSEAMFPFRHTSVHGGTRVRKF